jgi:hypothetical protein
MGRRHVQGLSGGPLKADLLVPEPIRKTVRTE